MCVRLFVTSEFLGTGRRNAAPLSPTWRASPGKLHRLNLEATWRMPRERKPLELFRWQRMKPGPSRYNGVLLKKQVVFLKGFELFRLQLGRDKEEQRLLCMEGFAKAGWNL